MRAFHVTIRTMQGVTQYVAIARTAQEVVASISEARPFGISVRPL